VPRLALNSLCCPWDPELLIFLPSAGLVTWIAGASTKPV
jgi:hypothetical protein